MKINQNLMLSFLWQVIKPYKLWYLLMIQAPIIGAFYNSINLYSLKLVIDAFDSSEVPEYRNLLYPISLFIGAILALELVWRVSQFAWMKSQPFVRTDIIKKSYDYVQHHSYSYFQNTHSGSISSQIKGIVTGYDNLWHGIHYRVANPLLIVLVGICSLGFINLKIFTFVIIWSCIFFPVMFKMSIRISKLSTITNNSKYKAIGLIADNISNIFSIFSFTARSRELGHIHDFLKNDVAKKDYNEIKYALKTAIIGGVLYSAMLFLLFLYMIHLRRINSVTTGDLMFVMTNTYFVVDNIWKLVSEIGEFASKLGDFKSSFSILQTPQGLIDTPNVSKLKITKGEIIFQGVSFNYENNYTIFKNLNIHIKPGEKIGIVGHSGAGKSTFISLLLKNFKVKTGYIIIDDQSIYDVSSDSLRSQISLIPQDIILFHRSIGENIGYAKENPKQEEIERAAKMANIHEFIENLPQKYNTLVGERGIKLSGGQRQRIAIARAILKNAPILILDEATSSLDSKTEQEIQKSINIMLEQNNVTVIVIAHRLSTIKHLDRIIVLESGNVVEDGSFKELVEMENGRFKGMWSSQINGMLV